MDKFGQNYGFWIKPHKDMTEEDFGCLRRGIELVCRITAGCAKYLDVNNAIMGFLIKSSPDNAAYLTVCFFDEITLFGIFEEKTNKIVNVLDCEKYKKLSYKTFKHFSDRCENILWEKKKGKHPAELAKLSIAWDNYLKENPLLVQKVWEAQTDISVLLERKDALMSDEKV